MPGIREKRRLPYSQEQMFDLVADVGSYGEFLPWVVATRVRSPEHLEVFYVDGPLKDLDNNWTFTPTEAGGCEIDFCVDFTFRNAVFEALAGQYFDRAFRKMVQAFEDRADELYGRENAAANL